MLPCKFQLLEAYQLASFKGHENGLIKIQKVDKVCNQTKAAPLFQIVCFFSDLIDHRFLTLPTWICGCFQVSRFSFELNSFMWRKACWLSLENQVRAQGSLFILKFSGQIEVSITFICNHEKPGKLYTLSIPCIFLQKL